MSVTNHSFEVTEKDFSRRVLEASYRTPVLVDFWADWCNPCRMLMPILAKFAEEMSGRLLLAKVNTDQERNLASLYGVRSLPTVKLFRNGEVADEFLGALPESEIRAFLERHIPRPSDALLSRVDEALAQGDTASALRLLDEVRRSDPGNPREPLSRARAHAVLEEFDAAEKVLASLPFDAQQKPEVVRLRALMGFHQSAHAALPAAELERLLVSEPSNSAALHDLAAHRVADGRYEEALELLLTLVRQDRAYGDDVGRKDMLALFEILGSTGDLVSRYRSRMFNALH